MKQSLIRWFVDAWYKEMYLSPWLAPFSLLYVDVMRLRRFLYRIGLYKSEKLAVPVIIVGNITVGGTGKTPLVIWLAQLLKQLGYRPGVISRGYTGTANHIPQLVDTNSDPALVGDEALVLAARCGCPVAIGQNRPAAAGLLLAEPGCNVIISDDGLQHYALRRDIEIVVIDGERRYGNGYCLPAGPLREPLERLHQVDLLVVNGGGELQPQEYPMQCRGEQLINLLSGEHRDLAEFNGRSCHAVAAIGNPSRFFRQLATAGLNCVNHGFPDHYAFTAADLQFNDQRLIIMTEKDAVKCRGIATAAYWYLPVSAELPPGFAQQLLSLLNKKVHG